MSILAKFSRKTPVINDEQFLQSKSQFPASRFPRRRQDQVMKEAIVKKDPVLTAAEFLHPSDIGPKRVRLPSREARRVPITGDQDFTSDTEMHSCRCDRWGHPCPDCLDGKLQRQIAPVES